VGGRPGDEFLPFVAKSVTRRGSEVFSCANHAQMKKHAPLGRCTIVQTITLAACGMLAGIPARGASAEAAAFSDPPKALFQPSPNYSSRLRHEKVEGRVVLSFIVDSSGTVTDLAVVRATEPRLVNPTLDAVKQWKFLPARKEGAPVSCRVIQGVTFSIPAEGN
jgi:TonB family protein